MNLFRVHVLGLPLMFASFHEQLVTSVWHGLFFVGTHSPPVLVDPSVYEHLLRTHHSEKDTSKQSIFALKL